MNWLLFLLNQITKDVMLVQEGKRPFTYSWFLTLIALVGWMEPIYYQGMEVEVTQTCRGTRYHNLWWLYVKERQVDCAIQFYLYQDALRDGPGKVPRLTEEETTKY